LLPWLAGAGWPEVWQAVGRTPQAARWPERGARRANGRDWWGDLAGFGSASGRALGPWKYRV
jgi:hypothetical protein